MTAGPDTVADTTAAAWLRWLPRALATLTFAGHALIAPGGDADPAFGAIAGTADPVTPVIARALALVPVGAPAYRLAVASALGAAIAVLLVARLVAAAGKDDAATVAGAAAAAAVAGLGLPLVLAGTHAGSASWLAAAVAAVLLLGHRVALGAGPASGLGAVIVVGVAVAIDATAAALIVPLVVLLVLRLRRGARWPLAAPALLALALTASLAQPLVRAATGRTTAIDGHAPRTLAALAGQRTPVVEPPPADALLRWLEDVGDAVGPLGIAAALVGAAALLAPRTRWLGVGVLVAIATGAAGELLAQRATGGALVALGAAALIGAGVTRVARAIPIASGQAAVGGALAVLVAASAALTTGHRLLDDASSPEPRVRAGNPAAGP